MEVDDLEQQTQCLVGGFEVMSLRDRLPERAFTNVLEASKRDHVPIERKEVNRSGRVDSGVRLGNAEEMSDESVTSIRRWEDGLGHVCRRTVSRPQ